MPEVEHINTGIAAVCGWGGCAVVALVILAAAVRSWRERGRGE